MRTIPSTLLFLLAVWRPLVAADSSPRPANQSTVFQAEALFKEGRWVEAERLDRNVLVAIDAGRLPKSELANCLRRLVQVYRTKGQNDLALQMAERCREFFGNSPNLDAAAREKQLENNLDLVDILAALNRSADAEQYLADAIKVNRSAEKADPVPRLLLLAKSAKLAEIEDDSPKARERWLQVVAEGKADLARIEKPGRNVKSFLDCAEQLAAAEVALEDYPSAIELKRRMLDLEIAPQPDRDAEMRTRAEIGSLYAKNGDFAVARSAFVDAIAIERKRGAGSLREADLLGRLAGVLQAQGFVVDAKQRRGDAAAIYAGALAKAQRTENGVAAVMSLLDQLETAYQQMGQYRDAVRVGRQLFTMRQQQLGKDHPLTVAAKADLGKLNVEIENYEEAEPLLKEAVIYWRRTPRAFDRLATALNDLGVDERAIGSFAEAESHAKEALAIRTSILRPDDLRLAYSLNNLASVYLAKGEYAKAISLYDRAIDIYHQRGAIAEDSLSNTLLTVAMAYKGQGQYRKASEYCYEALKTYQRVFGADAPGALSYYAALTSLDIAADQLEAAAGYNRHAWELCQANHVDHEPVAATVLDHRARIAYFQRRLDAAAADWTEALKIQQDAGQALQVAHTLNFLATVESLRGKDDQAESLYRKALALQQRVQASPAFFSTVYCNLGEVLHNNGKTEEALQLLQEAVKLVEVPRAGTVGAEEWRAEYFAKFASAFDLLVAWNLQAGRTDEAFQFAERGRNRTFLDQLSLAGVDLRETLTGPGAKQLLDRERTLRTKLGTLRGQMQVAAAGADSQPSLAELGKEYAATQDQFAQVWTDIRNASPFYREQLARGTPIGSLPAIRRLMGESNGLMLFYYLGSKESHLLIIGGEEKPVEVVPLMIPEALADGLHSKAGPLTRPAAVQIVSQYLADLRDRGGGRGLAGIVHSPKGVMAAEQGTQLAEVLLPRSVRKRIEERNPQGITIVPDGALHQLPFEALLLEAGASPRYLLDVFPPITYAPSATILVNLKSRPSADPKAAATLLTAGNPHYPQADEKVRTQSLAAASSAAVSIASVSIAAVSRDAFLELGGRLPLLPGTSKECGRVAEAFPPDRVKRLEWDDATESAVRASIAGRRYIHLAAHGLVDAQHDNLFGAIALTPGRGASESSDDDGFLSLHEIHALPLSGCELVVLSACQTNVGPDRPLEAGATLAQAFLAAGGRRVVCSHWNVDDASTAEMMGAFFEAIAKADRQSTRVNYSAALQEARKSIRANPQWSSPYYWAPFVLVGPAE